MKESTWFTWVKNMSMKALLGFLSSDTWLGWITVPLSRITSSPLINALKCFLGLQPRALAYLGKKVGVSWLGIPK